jgi:hypothetical protein
MSAIPFAIYDFFGYLASGFLLLAIGDYTLNQHWILRDDPGLVLIVVSIVTAYTTGHIIANISGFLLERHLMRRTLHSPEETLFWKKRTKGWRRCFPGHYTPFPIEIQNRVLDRAKQRAGLGEPSRALFLHCFATVKRDAVTRERLDRFLNLYGFCRNTCLALVLAVPILTSGLIARHWFNADVGQFLWWSLVASVIGAVGLFYRYLKFFRDFTVEVYQSYAEAE